MNNSIATTTTAACDLAANYHFNADFLAHFSAWSLLTQNVTLLCGVVALCTLAHFAHKTLVMISRAFCDMIAGSVRFIVCNAQFARGWKEQD